MTTSTEAIGSAPLDRRRRPQPLVDQYLVLTAVHRPVALRCW